MRVAAGVAIGGYVAIYVAIGTNKGIADTVILLGVLGPAALIAGRVRLSRRRARALGATVSASPLRSWLSSQSASSIAKAGWPPAWRSTPPASNGHRRRDPRKSATPLVARHAAYGTGPNIPAPPTLVVADRNNALLSPLPDKLARSVIALAGYMTQGYYGLSEAMQQPWVPTFGLGSSYFLVRNASRILGSSFEDRPYPMRVETHDGVGRVGALDRRLRLDRLGCQLPRNAAGPPPARPPARACLAGHA